MVSYADVVDNSKIKGYIEAADFHLANLGYTEHSFRHSELVSSMARDVLLKLGYPERDAELAAIAGYMHDIGNVVGRQGHSRSGAIISFRLLDEMGMPPIEVGKVITAIGNHEEDEGGNVTDPITAALVIADKADAHRSRVRNPDISTFDIHDRVNYAVHDSKLSIDPSGRAITLSLEIDTAISQVMEYFEIFLSRMLVSRKASNLLGCNFHLIINGVKLL